MSGPSLQTQVGSLGFETPLIAASGCFGYGDELTDLVEAGSLGGFVSKGISLQPRPGNPPPRLVETPSGLLNAIGLENVGLAAFVEQKLPALRDRPGRVIVNLFGQRAEDYAALAAALELQPRVDALELNISCPNVKAGGVEFGLDPSLAGALVAQVRKVSSKPLWVKLSPNAGDAITEVALAVAEAGADAISLVNTFTGLVVDVERRRPVLANGTGGLSGPAIRPLALRMVAKVAAAVTLPVVGIGGIVCAEDVIAFLLVGASAVQLGSVLFGNPRAPTQLCQGLRAYCRRHGIARLSELVGAIEMS